jgi:opacity protein-like surface antigen
MPRRRAVSIAAPTTTRRMLEIAGIIALAVCILAETAPAQIAGDGFLFRAPRGTVQLHGGFAQGYSNGKLFDDELLMADHANFSGPNFGADLGFRLVPRLHLTFSAGYAAGNERSEYRDWVDQNDLPIEQTTRISRLPVTVNLKAYVLPQGRSVGQLAWVPSRFAPYIGGGVGLVRFHFEQTGDYIDFQTQNLDVLPDHFSTIGTSFASQAMAGVDMALGLRFGVNAEVRTMWAKGELNSSFIGFQPLDLSSTNATVGLFVRF